MHEEDDDLLDKDLPEYMHEEKDDLLDEELRGRFDQECKLYCNSVINILLERESCYRLIEL